MPQIKVKDQTGEHPRTNGQIDTHTHATKRTSINSVMMMKVKQKETRNAWQSLAYSPLGALVSPPSEYL